MNKPLPTTSGCQSYCLHTTTTAAAISDTPRVGGETSNDVTSLSHPYPQNTDMLYGLKCGLNMRLKVNQSKQQQSTRAKYEASRLTRGTAKEAWSPRGAKLLGHRKSSGTP